jgi:hypothetical protein
MSDPGNRLGGLALSAVTIGYVVWWIRRRVKNRPRYVTDERGERQ